MTEVAFGLIVILAFILGWVLGARASRGKKQADGYLNVVKGDARLVFQLEINTPPEELQKQETIVLYVREVQPEPMVEAFDELG